MTLPLTEIKSRVKKLAEIIAAPADTFPTFGRSEQSGRAYDGEKPARSAGVQLAFQVAADQVEPCHRELLEKQVEILDPPRDWSYGHRTLFFRDPEGNILEIYADIQD